MANVRIGSDGSIIKDNVIVESDERTIIREDGTIETTSVGGYSAPPVRTSVVAVPPVSPLERNESNNLPVSTEQSSDTSLSISSGFQQRDSINLKAIKEKEYDLQVVDGRIKNAIPKSMIIATIVLCILGSIGLYLLFIPAVVTGILVFVGFVNKGELETERARMYDELQELERGN